MSTPRRRGLARLATITTLAGLLSCGGGQDGPRPAPTPPPAVTLVTVTPSAPSVAVGDSLQFAATVTGTGGVDTAVAWSVDRVAGGSVGSGTITAGGLYVTPFPAPSTVTVTATSKADASKTASANVTITPPAAAQGPDLSVDAAAARHAISPLIYGMNQYSASFADVAREVRQPLERWGGNATTRYNWQLDVTNAANDWYFTTEPNANANYPDTSEFNDMVVRNRAAGTRTMTTVPMIGWTTKRQRACGFSVAKYGPQKLVNPYNSDCGNGVKADGTEIVADPADTSVPIGPEFTRAWVTYLVKRYGSARSGGVAIYSLDNEPELWQWVHRDVHPEYPGYDELASRGIAYAAAIKQADSSALVSGPVTAGWIGYFYSPQDWKSGWSTGPDYVYDGNPVDRRAHGDVPFIEWYLQQFAAAGRKAGRRLLDYLDVHGYITPDEVTFKPAGDTATQVRRLEAVRAFWDAGYRVGGDIDDAPRLVPRMREWVARNYPGTRTSITEYNLGALDHINGALAQADLLGVFGRGGLDMATIWGPPDPGTPGMHAFKIFRNYDDAGSGFGDVSVSARSGDQVKLSIYAAERSVDQGLTIVVINKTFGELSSTVSLSGFRGASAAGAFRYSAAAAGIVRLPDQLIGDRSFSATFPAGSITLFDIEQR